MARLVLDPYILTATADITARQVFDCAIALYTDCEWDWELDEDVIDSWLATMRRKPGLALSTGRTKSARGMFTCALLQVLGVHNPKSVRTRMDVAWDILDSEPGRAKVGHVPVLEHERKLWLQYTGRGDQIQAPQPPHAPAKVKGEASLWPFPKRVL